MNKKLLNSTAHHNFVLKIKKNFNFEVECLIIVESNNCVTIFTMLKIKLFNGTTVNERFFYYAKS